MKYLFLLFISVTVLLAAMKRDNTLEQVFDDKTNLVWIDSKENVSLQLSHKEAVPYCESLSYASASTWRIPTIEEFSTIVDKRNEKTYINKAFRFNVPTGYWALKAHFRTFWFYADYMNFVSGTPYFDNRNIDKFVRCVRDNK